MVSEAIFNVHPYFLNRNGPKVPEGTFYKNQGQAQCLCETTTCLLILKVLNLIFRTFY